MNPSDYDLDELQGIAEEYGDDPEAGNGRGVAAPPGGADDVLESNQSRELALLESMSSGDLEKPYLEALPESYVAELTVFEWLEFLLGKAGYRGAHEALRYYRSIDWITPGIEDDLGEYMRSFDAPSGGDGSLDRSDHVLSLVYVARLSSMGE